MRRAALPLVVALLFILTPVVRAADVTIVSTFPADKGPGYRKPAPDAAAAVGPRHAVALDDRAFVAVDKATGKVVKDLTQHDFWLSVQPANTLDLEANDPRILYDPLCDRWIAWVQGIDPMHGYLAVSTTSDPTGPWKGLKFPIPPHNYGAKAGLDANGFYLTVHNGNDDTHKAHTCYAIPKADLIAADGPDLSHMQVFPDLEIESFPAMDLDPDKSADAPEVLLNKEFGNVAGKLFMYKIKWTGNKASISAVQTIPLSHTYSTPNASVEEGKAMQPAPGAKLRADEPRRTDCVFAHGGSVFGCNGAKRTFNSRPGILWYEVRVSDGVLLQEGLVDDPACDYLNPSLAVDRDGNVGLGCTRTSEKEFPSVYVMMHAAGDPAGSMGAPASAVAGTTYYRLKAPGRFGLGWGNYSTTCVDPADPTLLWTCQEYANSTIEDQWCTAWVAFRRKDGKDASPISQSRDDGRGWQAEAAGRYLDERATGWFAFDGRGEGATRSSCVSCHTVFPYILARPTLRKLTGVRAPTEPEARLLAQTRMRTEHWKDLDTAAFGLFYDRDDAKKRESRGTEAVFNAAILAFEDRDQGQKTPSQPTRQAFANLWATQVSSADYKGSWEWLDFNEAPWGIAEARYFGAALAAIAVGTAPGYDAQADADTRANVALLRDYLRNELPSQDLHNQAWALWAATTLEGILTATEKQQLISRLLEKQRDDGGWSLPSLGKWHRNDGTEQETVSDGYATGFVLHVAQTAGVPKSNTRVAHGLDWLKRNQTETGAWRCASLVKKRDPATNTGKFMSDAATAFAVLALSH